MSRHGARAVCILFLRDRKSTRLNSSHVSTSYAAFCLKKKLGGEAFLRRPFGASVFGNAAQLPAPRDTTRAISRYGSLGGMSRRTEPGARRRRRGRRPQ